MRAGDKTSGLLTPPHDLSEEEKSMVRAALDELIPSAPFRTSKQCQDLLRFVVEHSLSGEDESLRERMIGVKVFGRRPDYDQAEDPVVRIRAADVRKRIALFYQATAEHAHKVKIDIPSGSYKACFEFREVDLVHPAADPVAPVKVKILDSAAVLPVPAPATADRLHPGPSRSRTKFLRLLPLVAVCAALCLGYGYWHSTRDSAFDRFWSPVLNNPAHTFIYIGSNAVYGLSNDFVAKYREAHHLNTAETMGREFLVPFAPGETVNAQDLVPLKDIYVTVGDVAASTKISSLLTSYKKPFEMRLGGDITIGDLRQGPAILIGGFNNTWTLMMTGNLRFVFTPSREIQDRFGKQQVWRPDSDLTEDYAIISRILNSKTNGVLITAAGIGHAGTSAAGDFLTNPKAINSLLLKAPSGWEKENMQIVLHTTVINGSPGTPDVVATYYW